MLYCKHANTCLTTFFSRNWHAHYDKVDGTEGKAAVNKHTQYQLCKGSVKLMAYYTLTRCQAGPG